jgi:hypothetical protein
MPHNQFGFGDPRSYDSVTIGMETTDYFDYRTGLTAISTITVISSVPAGLYSTANSLLQGVVYEVKYGIFGNAAATSTISAAAYILGWTTAGATQTATVSISAVGGYTPSTTVLVPDIGTAVTATITKGTINGTAAFTVFSSFSRVI